MLLCCRDTTLAKDNVQEEIGIALDLARELPDPKFIIPLRLEPYKKVLGIGELQYVDFVRGWADGLDKLLETLKRQKIPCDLTKISINPNWEIYRRRGSIPIKEEPERLTSNWLRVAEAPDIVRYFEPSGAADLYAIELACTSSKYPAQPMQRGFVSFGTPEEINDAFATTGKFEAKAEIPLMEFIAKGAPQHGIQGKDASNVIVSMFRQAWNAYCRERISVSMCIRKQPHSTARGLKQLGQKIPWGKQGAAARRCCEISPRLRSGSLASPLFRRFGRFLTSSSNRACCSHPRFATTQAIRLGTRASTSLKALGMQRLAQQAMAWPPHGLYRDAIREFGVDRAVARRVGDNQARSRARSIFVAHQYTASELHGR